MRPGMISLVCDIAGLQGSDSTVMLILSAALFQGGGRPNLSGHLGTAYASLNGADRQGATERKLYLTTTRAVATLETEHGSPIPSTLFFTGYTNLPSTTSSNLLTADNHVNNYHFGSQASRP